MNAVLWANFAITVARGMGKCGLRKPHTQPHFFVLTRKPLTLLALQYLSAIAVFIEQRKPNTNSEYV
ncbi:hypothetical protein J2Y45_004312 [Dyadobacter sp. BE34]|uniref:Uncharacterized protein n=1 Tax=Dyadobacter fermentans TaxID=94254 RepID=A0ABU1R354_9BACT|nr:hypothetical protein [Dyadobacter fermentans]MDR7045095.1 hypothetical protein [Dyadobacter sp. BE242]MDR7199169.1 hypothetical protein [Dyadobacter sp. BE34]MDR7217129.1 hypothetical protein [Dyadobacter sp. BE31]MDR7265062.1 hypothetical protein [Dyadobacter sp. BE32]